MTRVAAYCRVSTDTPDQAGSFENQKAYFDQYIRMREGWTLYAIYADEGITGTQTEKRDGFLRMMEDARRGLFDLVITKEVSRFSRNLLDAVHYTRLLRRWGVGVIFLSDGISTLDGDAELRLGIMAAVAQEESRRTSERVRWGQLRQMEKGVVFGRSLLGYDVEDGAMTVNQEGAALVRRIYEMFLNERMGVRAIARVLTEQGVPTYTGGASWSGATVLKILKNEKYCGDLIQRKTYTPDFLTHKKRRNKGEVPFVILRDHHEAIIPRAVWEAVQAELARRSTNRNGEGGHGSRYALSGKITCETCGAAFFARTRKNAAGQPYRRWYAPCACSQRRSLSEKELSEAVRKALNDAFKTTPPSLLQGIGERTARKKGEELT
jgi:DNA invertase Pin-like site-specific DNA recombinase